MPERESKTMSGSNTSHRSPRGRSNARRKKLPPIPERSLSSQKQASDSIGSRGISGGFGLGKNARAAVPPSPESRKSASQQAVAAIESRDDDEVLVAAPAAADKVLDAKSGDEIMVPPSPPKPTYVSTPVQTEVVSVSSGRGPQARHVSVPPGISVEALAIPIIVSDTRIVSQISASVVSAMPTFNISQDAASVVSAMPRPRTSYISQGAASVVSARPKTSNVFQGAASAMSAMPTFNVSQDAASVVSTIPGTSNVSQDAASVVCVRPRTSDSQDAASVVFAMPTSKTQATQTHHGRPSRGNSSNNAVVRADKQTDVITPFTSNVSRKRIVSVVGTTCDDTRKDDVMERSEVSATKYTPEPSWEKFQRTRSEATDDSPDGPPEITSIPTDEIMDSFMKNPSGSKSKFGNSRQHANDCSNISDEENMDYTSRDTRDQYQLGRLQARINRRSREQHREVTNQVFSPNYKTLRSSRIKTVRNLYHTNTPQSRNCNNIHEHSGTNSIHGSIANNTSSTIPSIAHGNTISRSLTSSSASGVQSISNSGVQHASISHQASTFQQESISSEYRGKLFAKMLTLLQDLSPTKETLLEDDVTHIKDMVINEGRASCCSIAELKLIQKLTEEEMSRILLDFEQSNSLIDKKDTVVYKGIPDFKGNIEREPPGNNARSMMDVDDGKDEIMNLPEKIMYHDTNIASKFSDVTSPTCHDGFELDEIIPIRHHRHQQPMMLPPLPRSPGFSPSSHHHNKKRLLLTSLSPAAASVAVSVSLASGNNNNKEVQSLQKLPCVLEFPDTIELNEDTTDNAVNNNGKGEQALAHEDDAKRECDEGKALVTQDEVRKGTCTIMSGVKYAGDSNHLEPTNQTEVHDSKQGDSIHNVPAMIHVDDDDEEEDTENKKMVAAVLASSRETAKRAVDEEHFHDEILNAVAHAAAKQRREDVDAEELNEVTTILSQYEEAEKHTKEQGQKAKDEMMDKHAKEEDTYAKLVEGSLEFGSEKSLIQGLEKSAGVLPLCDEPTKKVTFFEPLPDAQNPVMCGCTIQ